ncbi:DUF6671 family protein [Flavobacterium praedii]|uniref:DUF6671 family protein n=1 Tax=Flavobacterium praedii TaxID=3002900 RepID=UPI002481A601|nr:DUF6671 family protein [Flavobacterium praedii]
MFAGRKLLIATKHEKEKVIAPILARELGVKCFVVSNFDTDELGTFTGEIDRKEDPINTAKKKCLMAMELTNCDMAIASEGSFGSHPSIFFAPADDEFLFFIDKKNNLEIVARELSMDTNFSGAVIHSKQELDEFAGRAKFPSHALIARKSIDDFIEIEKGISDWGKLVDVYNHFIKLYGSVYIETDMRAMYNPTRMNVIESAALKLADKINSCCPNCNTPGFGVTDAKLGLPCEWCRFPTQSTLSHIYTCQKCSYVKEEMYPNQKKSEDPTYCDNCNP